MTMLQYISISTTGLEPLARVIQYTQYLTDGKSSGDLFWRSADYHPIAD